MGALLGAMCLSACVVLPVPTPPTGSEIVGDEAMKAIKPGTTTRADVLLALGDPNESDEADRFFAYDWKVSYGAIVWAWGIAPNVGGAGGHRLWAYRCLAIEFGPDATVARTANLHLGSEEANGCLAHWRKQGTGDEPQQ
jgi:outer membrane protein assembly factor BamE (lipoprotein component of BamABCDE complex)